MAAEPGVTARDAVKEVGGKDGGGREKKARKRERGQKGVRGFYFKSPRTPRGTSLLAASATKINHLHQREHLDHSPHPKRTHARAGVFTFTNSSSALQNVHRIRKRDGI